MANTTLLPLSGWKSSIRHDLTNIPASFCSYLVLSDGVPCLFYRQPI